MVTDDVNSDRFQFRATFGLLTVDCSYQALLEILALPKYSKNNPCPSPYAVAFEPIA
jgi:hypothetical protein